MAVTYLPDGRNHDTRRFWTQAKLWNEICKCGFRSTQFNGLHQNKEGKGRRKERKGGESSDHESLFIYGLLQDKSTIDLDDLFNDAT